MVKVIKSTVPIKKDRYDDFDVYSYSDRYSFIHIELKDTQKFYEKIFEYFFDQDRLIKYAEGKTGIKFSSTKRDYTTLFRHLKLYIDDYNEAKTISDLEEDLKEILLDEDLIEDEGSGVFSIRLDKIGRMGEYFFSCLLSEYFRFDCIIPKVHLTSDPNMSVYGIDTMYYNSENDEILFGESKFSKSLSNGIGLINTSLKTYEQQMKDEFLCILSSRFLSSNLNIFTEKYGEYAEVCIDIYEFIQEAKIKSIGIPIFIAHGNEKKKEEIINQLSKIKKINFWGIPTTYYCISLPVISKAKLVSTITVKIRERMQYYEKQRKCN
ncbi:Hachiman antiphage defense system protein HamA [Clostridium magnum]|uniref:Anti-bacteriophage protein A/HamA C-terminal domain-containing protein n=1 Tax=Clostridium magnum DSM 2767 TaxID=1121326 RepID=A0A161X5Z2_9CLOT|nr:Hachiman antiphage defense system protein HamA [Clostridium magnum]KZL89406.1 hypothetical protein CLMAG_53100 [Clostridium magnum DSM 2767]SHI20596.1 protein of unknown function [Clostridium magnum DSM 2767]